MCVCAGSFLNASARFVKSMFCGVSFAGVCFGLRDLEA